MEGWMVIQIKGAINNAFRKGYLFIHFIYGYLVASWAWVVMDSQLLEVKKSGGAITEEEYDHLHGVRVAMQDMNVEIEAFQVLCLCTSRVRACVCVCMCVCHCNLAIPRTVVHLFDIIIISERPISKAS